MRKGEVMKNSKKQIEIAVGTVVQNNGGLFRILVINEKQVILIQLEIEKLNIVRVSMDFFKYGVSCGEFTPVEREEKTALYGKLKEEEELELSKRVELVERMLQKLYPEWERLQSREIKEEVEELKQALGLSAKSTYKAIRRYLQSGRQRMALMDGRKGEKNRSNVYEWGTALRGHGTSKVANDDKLKDIYEDGYNYFYQNREKGVTVAAAYRYIVGKYYTTTVLNEGTLISKCLETDEIPSYKRFWHYCSKKHTEPISKLKISARERRNNERILRGNSQFGCLGPGHIVEVDEVEIDMINVSSRDSRQVTGRAVMYLAVDVYSCCIVGCWVDYANNSFVGITNLLMGFLEEPAERFERYGIKISKEICPSGFVPMELRTDHGAEYTSSDIRRIGREIGMNLSLVAPGTGSLKGLVEQAFHQFQELLRGAAAGVGTIMKSYDSKHYETACTDIEDIRKIAYEFVVYFNQHKRDYPLTKDMITLGIPPVPVMLWKYGCENVMAPRWLTGESRERFLFALLKEDRIFKMSRQGLVYKNLHYELPEEWFWDEMKKSGNCKIVFQGVRYDPRSVGCIYMMRNGDVIKIPLSEIREEQKTFQDMTWKAYDELWKTKKETEKSLEHGELERAAFASQRIGNVVETARRLQDEGRNRKKHIRLAMKEEREKVALENTVEARIKPDNNPDTLWKKRIIPLETEKETMNKPLPVLADDDFSDVDDMFGA